MENERMRKREGSSAKKGNEKERRVKKVHLEGDK